MSVPRLLFICSYNIARSRTAENLLIGSCEYEVESAGFIMDKGSGQLVTQALIDWADIIFLMDEDTDHHLTLLTKNFSLKYKKAIILGIPNIYRPGDPILIRLLREKLALCGISFKST